MSVYNHAALRRIGVVATVHGLQNTVCRTCIPESQWLETQRRRGRREAGKKGIPFRFPHFRVSNKRHGRAGMQRDSDCCRIAHGVLGVSTVGACCGRSHVHQCCQSRIIFGGPVKVFDHARQMFSTNELHIATLRKLLRGRRKDTIRHNYCCVTAEMASGSDGFLNSFVADRIRIQFCLNNRSFARFFNQNVGTLISTLGRFDDAKPLAFVYHA